MAKAAKPNHGLRQNTNAGIHGGHLHGGPFRHRLAGAGAAHIERVGAASRSVLGLVFGAEKAVKNAHRKSSPFQCLVEG